MTKTLLLTPLIALAFAGSGVASVHAPTASPSCPTAWRAGWQKLADRIRADVYCPSYVPDPLTAQIGGRWNNINSVSKDRSYLIGFVWQEVGEEIHINLRGYPGVTKVPTCRTVELVGGKRQVGTTPCFADAHGQKTIGGIRVTEYTVNQDADQWHILYAWRHNGSLYTLSQHVAPPYTLPQVVKYLDRMMRALVLVHPSL